MLMIALTLLATSIYASENNKDMKKEHISGLTKTIAKAKEKSQPLIQESINNGRFVRLSDDSLWEIHPNDTSITQSWITPVEIIVAPSDDPNYPFTLTNSLTKSKVLAKKASQSKNPNN